MDKSRRAAIALVALVVLALAPAAGLADSDAHAAAAASQHAHRAKPKTARPARQGAKPRRQQAAGVYACPMHPDVSSASPGKKCHECGMTLVKAEARTEGKAEATKAGSGAATSAAPAPNSVGAPGEAPQIPDVPVLDQTGRRLNFYSDLVKGKTVAINFVFTTCTTVCPPLTATFRKVQQTLGERVGRDVELISVSVDPVTDTPERLKSFSAKFNAGPGWTFVTGGKPEISALLKALGASTPDKNDHTPMILVGNDAARHWTRTYGLAPASTLVKVIDEVAAKKGAGPAASLGEVSVPLPVKEKTAGDGAQKTAATTAEASAKYFPNHVLLTQDNKPVRFYDDLLKGKVVLINFVFTTCAGVCPPMTANLAKVQTYLGDRVGKDVVMLSISVDPTVDTPEKLKKYADNFKAGRGWYFLTGEKQNVDWVLYKLGGYVEDKMKHSAILIIGNEATGEWVKTAALKNPAQIAEAVLQLLKTDKAGDQKN